MVENVSSNWIDLLNLSIYNKQRKHILTCVFIYFNKIEFVLVCFQPNVFYSNGDCGNFVKSETFSSTLHLFSFTILFILGKFHQSPSLS